MTLTRLVNFSSPSGGGSSNDRAKDFFPTTITPSPVSPKTETRLASIVHEDFQRAFHQPCLFSSPRPEVEGGEDELDKQEREIIASLEMEEREHKRYMEMKGIINCNSQQK